MKILYELRNNRLANFDKKRFESLMGKFNYKNLKEDEILYNSESVGIFKVISNDGKTLIIRSV